MMFSLPKSIENDLNEQLKNKIACKWRRPSRFLGDCQPILSQNQDEEKVHSVSMREYLEEDISEDESAEERQERHKDLKRLRKVVLNRYFEKNSLDLL